MKKRYRKLSNLFVVLLLVMNVLSSFVPASAMEATTSAVSELVETNSAQLKQGDKPATEVEGANAKDKTSPAETIEAIATMRTVTADGEDPEEAEEIFASPVSTANRTITSLVLKQNGKVLNDNDLTDYWGSMEVTLSVELTGAIRDGDTLTLNIPPQLRLTTAGTFPVTTPSRAEVGQAKMDPDARTVTVTFNDYFTTRPDEQQINLQFFVNWDHTNSQENALNTLNFEGMTRTLRKGSQGKNPVNETLTKWGRVYFADRDQVRWTVRVNGKQDRVSNVVVTDTFDPTNQEYVPGSLTGEYISSSVPYVVVGAVPAEKLRVDANGFTYTDDLIDGVTVVIKYRTRVTDSGASFFYKNSATYSINNGADLVNSVNAVYVYEGGSGKGSAVTADKIVLKANKTLTGRPLQDGEFQFQLKDQQGQVLQTKSNVGGEVTFDKFGIKDLGNYRYTIEEVNNHLPNVTYDTTPVTVDIEVVEINNVKYAKIIYSDDQTFENVYQIPAVPVAPVIQATVQSEPCVKGDIEVELVNEQGAVVSTQTVPNANGTVTFTLPNETTENTKAYKVRQKGVADTAHVLYDKEEREVIVTVTKDDATNTLTASVAPEAVVFVNVCKDPTPVAPIIQATVQSEPCVKGDIEVELVNEQGAVVSTQTVPNANGTVTFTLPNETSENTKTYKVRQKGVADTAHVLYDKAEKEVTVVITKDDTTNALVATSTPNEVVFTNVCKDPAPVAPVIQATVQSEPCVKGDIEVELVNEQGAVVATQTVQNANGTVTFTLPNEMSENTKTYKVRQKGAADTAHVLYDKEERDVTVVVTKDDATNTLVATVTPEAVVFVNVCKDPAPVAPVIQATVQSEPCVKGDIEVELVNEQGAVVATQTVQNANGTVTFTLPNETSENTKTYKVRQKGVAETAHVLYDKEERDVTVVITKDDTTNALVATVTPEAVVFVNVCKAPTPTKVMLEATVKHEGCDMKSEPTEFELVDSNETVLQTVKSTADGKVRFAEMPYDKAGEATYKIRQKATNTAFVDYDNREIEVTVKVGANDQNQLVAMPEYKVDPTFVNMCIPPVKSEITIEANVRYEGDGTVPGPTEFELLDSVGNVLQRATSKDGKVVFEKISVTQTGKLTYQIRQIAGKESDVKFDAKVMTVTIDVTNVDGNRLAATATYTDEATFVNTSTVAQNKPQENKPSVPTNESNQVAQTKERAQATQNKNDQSQLPNTGTANTWLTSVIGFSLLVAAVAITVKKTEKNYSAE